MRSADLRTEVYRDLDALPEEAGDLFGGGFFGSRAWWAAVIAHAMPPGTEARLVLISRGQDAQALFPMMFDPADGEFRALTTPYTCVYEPLFASGVSDRGAVYAAFARVCRGHATARLDALNPETADALSAGVRAGGLVPARFDHFGNWHEDISGLDWAGYLARRPGALRETIRRRTRRVEREASARYRLFDGLEDLEAGIAAFQAVYARSWKEPEPFPEINPAQIRAAAQLGIGRLGVYWIGDTPAAAQFWIVERGLATVLKLAHDEAFKPLSLGTVLTARLIRHMTEVEGASGLDFGRGDDPYKADWVSTRRQRVGVLLIDPWRPRGAMALGRHWAGRVRRRLGR